MTSDGAVATADLDRWCVKHLGAGFDSILFLEGNLSTVVGVRLTSGAQVVVKIRRWAERLRGCAAVHRLLFERRYACPEPLVDLEPIEGYMASAEAMVIGGDRYPCSGRAAAPFAAALARLVRLAPPASEIPSVAPFPPWMAPDLPADALWPPPDDCDVDLNAVGGPAWVDEAGRVARTRLASTTLPIVVGHGDFHTGNVRWRGDDLASVWDWDGAVVAPEAAVAGLAAAVYPTTVPGTEATVEESEAFLDAYQVERGRFSPDELTVAWAAGLWTRSFDAKEQSVTEGSPRSLTEAEAIERCRRVRGP